MPTPVPDSLLIPVETLNREFDGKLLLALCAAEHGLPAIIGGRTSMHERLPALPRSIYLSKDVRSASRRVFRLLEALGHTIVALDEEALARFDDDLFLKQIDPDAFPRARVLFAWGEANAAVWRQSQWYTGAPIITSGNPRTDMMRMELRPFHAPEIASLKDRFGDFVLFNSNFGVVNHFIPGQTRFRVADWVPPEDVDEFRAGFLRHRRALFEHFLALIPSLSRAIAPRTLVVRPHPSEDAEAWREVAKDLPNVAVVHEGSVVPWLAAASVLIHNGCTSAVEAAAIGTPALAFRPVLSDTFDVHLPNSLSENYSEAEALIERARAIAAGAAAPLTDDRHAILAHHLAGLDGAFSSERIVAALVEQRSALSKAPGASWQSRMRGRLDHAKRRLRTRLRDRRRRESTSAYMSHKFPGIGLHSVQERIGRFQHTLGRFEGMQAREIEKDIFEIHKA